MTKIGIIGSGMLGGAIARRLIATGAGEIAVANRSGQGPDGAQVTTDAQSLIDTSDLVLLCVPPAAARDLSIRAVGKLVVSVMAGVSLGDLTAISGSHRVVRAMSSPAAELGLAYSPWVASAAITDTDRAQITEFFGALGTTDEVHDEAQIELFTAMTGPVPGFVAQFAATMVDYAMAQGVDPKVADRAVRQLFRANGEMMAEGQSPADHVREMVDYAGTTAAGLLALRDTDLALNIARGLDAAVEKTRRMND